MADKQNRINKGKNEIDNLHLNWSAIAPREFSHPPRLAPYKILGKGIEDPYNLSNLKFTISQNKVFEILEGSLIESYYEIETASDKASQSTQ